MQKALEDIAAIIGNLFGHAIKYFLIGFFLTAGVVEAAKWLVNVPNLGIN